MTVKMTTIVDQSATDETLPIMYEAGIQLMDPSAQTATIQTIKQYVANKEHNLLAYKT